MMKEMTCIGCPIGCALTVEIRGEEILVQGNTCPKGKTYAEHEITDPRRMLTSTVALKNAAIDRLSVRTAQEIPKDKIFDCMQALRGVCVSAPVRIGDVILADCAGTGIAVIATKCVEAEA